ncbi:MAG TPA: FtsW/RodA/SpoVE family cell cycle protein [Limnochordales bacterium]
MSRWSWRARIEARALERSLLAGALVPCCALIALARWTEDGGWPLTLGLAAGYALLFLALHVVVAVVRPQADSVVLPLVALLSGVSLALLARIDGELAVRQLRFFAAGGVALVALTAVDPLRVPPRVPDLVAAGAVLVLGLTAVWGVEGGGARSWLHLGPLRFQPVEPAKVLLVWCWAQWLAPPTGVPKILAVATAAALALVTQRELGYPLLVAVTAAAMIYVATGRRRVVAGTAAAAAAGVAAANHWFPHLAPRVLAWLDPWSAPFGAGYQALQALFALAEGGLLGRGIGVGAPAVIPAVHTDYLLAAVGEELGFVGSASLLAASALLVGRAFFIARQAPSGAGRLLAAGLGLVVGLQAVWMAGGLVRALPLSGVGLPFVSYGGSAAVAHMAAVGLLLRVSGPALPALAPGPPVHDAVSRRLVLISRGLALTGLIILALLGYWQLARADLRAHPYNPRPAVQGRLVSRGGILDRHGEALAQTYAGSGGPERRLVGPDSLIHVVGYAHPRYGFTGIEAALHADLAGLRRGLADWWRDPLRRRPQGREVWLTIDARVQAAAERALAGRRGAVVVLRPQTGEVLAMISHPAFAVEDLPVLLNGGPEAAPLFNRATQGLYPPGSTFKVLVMAAAFNAGLIPSQDELEALQGALAVSSNEPFERLGLELGARELAAVAGRVGFGTRLPIEVAQAVSPLPGAASHGDLAQASIGQGDLLATPLQMAVVAAAIAHGGVAMKPHLVREVRTADGTVVRFTRIEPLGPPAFSAAAARAVTEGMVRAVEEGTARRAALPGVRVAGKTGTAENPHGEPHAWFIGFAPAFRPEAAVAVVLEGGGSGGQAAAPVGAAVLAAALEALAQGAEVNP